MGEAKLMIDLRQGIVDLEGDRDFVERVYGDLKKELLGQITKLASATTETVNKSEEEKPRSRNRAAKSGPSCSERIELLKNDGFFQGLKSAQQIREKLAEKGTTYAGNQVAAALTSLTKRGIIRRVKADGVWKYQNP